MAGKILHERVTPTILSDMEGASPQFTAAPTTGISWTTHTWNPVSGCTEVSPGCDHCYARIRSERFRGTKAFPNGFDVTLRPHKLKEPLGWKDPARIFVNSMSDLWHRLIPDRFIEDVWATMIEADHHIYQILTKRPDRMERKIAELDLPLAPHIWLGVSAENQKFADARIPPLLRVGAEVSFVSAEPLLGPIDFRVWLPGIMYGSVGGASWHLGGDGVERYDLGSDPLNPVTWIIVGGESGSGRRPMDYNWARSIRDQCADRGVAFFYKQGNAFRPGQDDVLDGRVHHEYPG